jgi:hypothetical protein
MVVRACRLRQTVGRPAFHFQNLFEALSSPWKWLQLLYFTLTYGTGLCK